jgi:hypothetical protein
MAITTRCSTVFWLIRMLVHRTRNVNRSNLETIDPYRGGDSRYLLPKLDLQRDSRSRLDDIANMRTIQAIYLGGKKFE